MIGMLQTAWVKPAAYALAVLVLLGIGYESGSSRIQKQWDTERLTQAAAVATTLADAQFRVASLQSKYEALNSAYVGVLHAPAPKISDAVTTAVQSGTLRLRHQADTCPVDPSAATDRSRAADAAATQALAQRVSDSIAAVRVGDASDARELQLGAQVIALQGIVRADREPQKP